MSHSFGTNEILVLPLGKGLAKAIHLAARRGGKPGKRAATPLRAGLKSSRRRNSGSGKIGQNRLHPGV